MEYFEYCVSDTVDRIWKALDTIDMGDVYCEVYHSDAASDVKFFVEFFLDGEPIELTEDQQDMVEEAMNHALEGDPCGTWDSNQFSFLCDFSKPE